MSIDTKNLEKEFHVSSYIILYKFILGVIEVILGLGILVYGKQIIAVYRAYKVRELVEDPHDLLVSVVEKILPFVLAHESYFIVTLILLGLVKMTGAIGLYWRKRWGLDVLVGITLLLLPFDLYGVARHPTFSRFIYLIVNVFIFLFLINFKPKKYFIRLRHVLPHS